MNEPQRAGATNLALNSGINDPCVCVCSGVQTFMWVLHSATTYSDAIIVMAVRSHQVNYVNWLAHMLVAA
jgi:hypothetical protein